MNFVTELKTSRGTGALVLLAVPGRLMSAELLEAPGRLIGVLGHNELVLLYEAMGRYFEAEADS